MRGKKKNYSKTSIPRLSITVAGANESNVTGLVYISAFAPDVGEAISELSGQMPTAPGQANIRPDAEGFLWIDPKAFPESFAQDVDPVQAREVISMPADHASMVSHPTEVTKLITDAANATAKWPDYL